MFNFIIVLLYIFFFKNFNIKFLLISNLKIINISMILFFILISYFYIIIKIKNKLIIFLTKQNMNLYFSNYYDLIKSLLFMVFFTLYYVIYLRIMIFFTEKNIDINFYNYLNKIQIITKEKSLESIFLLIFGLMIFYVIIFCIFYAMIFFAKKNFLKFHYYYFLRKNFYRKSIEKIQDFELSISNYCFYNYFVFIKFYGFRILIAVLFLYCMFLGEGDVSKILKIMPYYAIYYFVMNIYNYIIYILNYDFDVLVIESYYKNIGFLMEKSEYKKREYIKLLLSNSSKYKFRDSIMLLYGFDKNVLVIEIYKYTNNKKPNDFFAKIKKVKPMFHENNLEINEKK